MKRDYEITDRIWLTESVTFAVSAHSWHRKPRQALGTRHANPMILFACEDADHKGRMRWEAWHGTCHWEGRCLTISKKLAKYLGEGTKPRAAEGNFRRFSFWSNNLVFSISRQEATEPGGDRIRVVEGSATSLGWTPTPPSWPSSKERSQRPLYPDRTIHYARRYQPPSNDKDCLCD